MEWDNGYIDNKRIDRTNYLYVVYTTTTTTLTSKGIFDGGRSSKEAQQRDERAIRNC